MELQLIMRSANSCIYIYCSLTSAIRVYLQGAHDSFVHCQGVRRRWGWSRTGRTRCSTSARSPCSEAFRHFEASQGRPWAFVSRGWERKKGRPQAPCDPWGGHVSQRRASRPLRATAAQAKPSPQGQPRLLELGDTTSTTISAVLRGKYSTFIIYYIIIMWPLYWQLARGAQLFRWHQTLEAPAGRSEIPSFLSGARRNRHPWFVKTSAAVSSENSQETDGSKWSNMPIR